MNNDIHQYLKSVEISYRFAKDTQHGVWIQYQQDWNPFEPTRFIYAFFAFNMLYEVDWEKTSQTQSQGIIWQDRGRPAKKNFGSFTQFIYEHKPKAFNMALEKLDQERALYQDVLSLTYDRNTDSLSFRNDKETVAEAFLRCSKKYADKKQLDALDHFDMLQFCYAVRNNIFHGNKKAHEMRKHGQLKRFVHYGNILLASCEAFFTVMDKKIEYERVEGWEIQDNYSGETL